MCSFDKLKIEEADVQCKRVLIRADFDVPMADGQIACPEKILATVPTIKSALERGAKLVVIISHLGDPKGKQDCSLSLNPVVDVLSEALCKEVKFLPDVKGQEVESALCQAEKGDVFLCENLRFHIEETGKGEDACGRGIVAKSEDVECFKKALKKLGDVYVNDAISASCCGYASMLAEGFEVKAAGCALVKEYEAFKKLTECPEKPVVVIIGGSTFADKVGLIIKMLDIAEEIIITGGPALTFLKATCGVDLGCSMFDEEGAQSVQCLVDTATEKNVSFTLPDDFIVGNDMSEDADTCEVAAGTDIPAGFMGLDVGVKSRKKFRNSLQRAKTIIWTGPPGVYEIEKFSCGSRCMMKGVAAATKCGAFSAVVGRVTHEIPALMNMEKEVSFLSRAGEAGLALLEGTALPGIEILSPKPTDDGC